MQNFTLLHTSLSTRHALVDGAPDVSEIDEIELAGRVYRDEAGTLAICDVTTGSMERDQYMRRLRRKLAVVLTHTLPARQRLVIVRRYFEDCTLPEIAKELNVTLASAARLQSKALTRMAASEELREFLNGTSRKKVESKTSTRIA